VPRRRFLSVSGIILGGVVVLAAAACGDSTGPESNVTVTVSLTQLNGPSVLDLGAGEQRVECELDLRASASGAARATWRDATVMFYAGKDRRTPIDSAVVPATDIQDAWGSPDIGPGETQQSAWRFSAGIPFGIAFVYRYQPEGGGVRSTRVAFTCGPEIPFLVEPPRVTGVTLLPQGIEIAAGDQLTVGFTAQSDLGLWSTDVRLLGACALEQHFAEPFLKLSEHTVIFTIPAACTLGAPLSVQVTATDAALQSSTTRGPRSFSVVDRTPPYVYADRLPTASTYLFTGDTLQPFVAATDNGIVRSIVWEIQPFGVRDSIAGAGGWFLSIPIRPEWAGTSIQLRLFARDAAGLVSDTLVAPVGGLPIYPTVQRPMRVANLAGDIQELAFDEKRGLIYLMQAENNCRIGVFSVATMSIVETIDPATCASDMDLTPGGDSLVLSMPYDRMLGIIDLQQSPRTMALLPIQSLATGQAPWQLRVGANGKAYVILTGATPAPTTLLELDLLAGSERLVPLSGSLAGARFERSFDRTVFAFQRMAELFQRYDVMNDQFGPVRTPRSLYGPLRLDDHGATVALGLDVYDGSLDFVRRVASVYGGEAVPGSALSKDGAYLHQALGYRGVARTRTSDGAVIDRVVVPFAASSYLRISPDGNTLIVMDSFVGTAKLALVDLR
jgi:hypothetical protein